MQPHIRNDGLIRCGWRPEMTPQVFLGRTPQLRVLEWLSAQPWRKASRTMKDSRTGRNLERTQHGGELAGILALADSLSESKRWSRVVFGCWQLKGVIHELKG